ncbi:uncharacterized protein LOC126970603 [Leptidea sinapis]|uniref:Translation initiation factor 3 N-terminal domain-containing protein n=1 Tax=Leptidea sinapis TaxID=189913 RepID=A0A5E4PUP1_9NEOP|nr:uncharacterized protein LOC126970603 [Leptidea sinapis]VVC89151.1 unnamed protein product [Leptidea sinapis]
MNKVISLCRLKSILDFRTITMKISADGKNIPKQKFLENRITLISPDNAIAITDLKSAQSLSVRRDLKLVKIQDEDSKTRRPVYKLMTNAEYHQEELLRRKQKQEEKQNSAIKGQKLVTLSSRIAVHDLMTNIKKIEKLLAKHYEVKVVVTGEDNEKYSTYDTIYNTMEKNLLSSGKLVQRRNKGNTLKFQILPSRESSGGKDPSDQNNNKGPL